MKYLFSLVLLLVQSVLFAQSDSVHNKGIFKEYPAGYYPNSILKGIEKFEKPEIITPKKYLKAEVPDWAVIDSFSNFKNQWYNSPVSQGKTGTCWSFAATSFFESEIYRVAKQQVKLSEMYFVYWEYVERAKVFVQKKGEVTFSEGSESNAVPKIMLLHGAMAREIYSGLLPGQTVFDHSKMIEELETYLKFVKDSSFFNEGIVVGTVKNILNSYMTQPPDSFTYQGVSYTPVKFLKEYCKILPADYFSFMSDNSDVFNQLSELKEDDNWRKSRDYYNVNASDFVGLAKDAIKNNNSFCICGDVSEPGISSEKQVMFVPDFDIPSEYIDDNARQVRLSNGSTTDDHCIHIVGYQEKDGHTWFLAKDSGAGAFDGKYKGYRFIREDYIKLKMMNILIYKYAARKILDSIIK
jgi:bleomycin hydrolase